MKRCKRGFSLIELIVVVGILALLIGMGVPHALDRLSHARYRRAASDFRTALSAFEIYAAETGNFPADSAPGEMPAGMSPFLSDFLWNGKTCLGGIWDWYNASSESNFGVRMTSCTFGEAALIEVDEILDDGNPASGRFLVSGSDALFLVD